MKKVLATSPNGHAILSAEIDGNYVSVEIQYKEKGDQISQICLDLDTWRWFTRCVDSATCEPFSVNNGVCSASAKFAKMITDQSRSEDA